MGKIAADLADVLIVTDDNPRSEDPAAIRRAILEGTADGSAEVVEIGDRRAAIAEAIRKANRAIIVEARRRAKQMGSTVVALFVRDERYAVLWVGDSRAYLLRDGALKQLSHDHTQVQEMVARGIMSPEDAIGHPMGHILSRAVGVRDEIEVDKVTGEVWPGDIFLICSDGLHGYVAEADIVRTLTRSPPEHVTEELVEMTLANGAPDNVTVIAVWASDPTLLSLPDR